MIIQSKKVWFADQFVEAQIEVKDGKIVDIYEYGTHPVDCDYGDNRILPGFIDVHCHGAYGFDTNDAKEDGLRYWVRNIVDEGVTALLATTITQSEEVLTNALKNVAKVVEDGYEGAEILGVHFEGPYLDMKYKGAQPEQYIVKPTVEQFKKYQEAANGLIKYITMATETDDDFALTRYCAENGVVVSIGHSAATSKEAVQAFAHVPIDVDEYNIDMLSSSGHKLNGPKGIGFLYIRKGVKIRSFIHGGAQERKRRAGTENVPGIVGYGKAVELAMASMDQRIKHETELRDYAIARIEKEIPYCRLNGDRVKRVPNNINFSFQFVEGESLLIMLDMKGICASSGSACTSGSLDPSHVLLAIGLPHEIAHGSLRMSLGADTTKEDIDYTIDQLKEIVAHLRSMSPLYEDFMKKQQKNA